MDTYKIISDDVEHDNICSICLESLIDPKTNHTHEMCRKKFHTKCIVRWVVERLKLYKEDNVSCPICRKELNTDMVMLCRKELNTDLETQRLATGIRQYLEYLEQIELQAQLENSSSSSESGENSSESDGNSSSPEIDDT